MSDKYVKELNKETWEVKLGAGILPVTITQATLDFHNIHSGSTFVCGPGGIEAFVREANAVAAVNKYLAEKAQGE